ncbi:MAG TPA: HAD family hydrolase [Terriglobales bacterium]|nr:HAD family hydrolase [Terriglobales bacterium]
MTQIACSALLFDLDGVLIDSTPAVTRVWRQWAIAHGFDPDDVVRKAHGRPSISTIRDYLPHANHEAENREVERREIADLNGVVPLPGARELLDALPPDRWTIVTSCTRPLAEVRLRAAGLPIPPHLLTCDDVQIGKPDPEPYLKGASLLGVSARDCIVVEDVPAGIRSGKTAGARVIACRTTVSESDLKDAGADWIVDGCKSISVSRSVDELMLTLQTEA